MRVSPPILSSVRWGAPSTRFKRAARRFQQGSNVKARRYDPPMNRVALAFLALTENVPSGRESEYLEWHSMQHMPEMFSVPGLVHAARWRSTAACRKERLAQLDSLASVENVVVYLMGEPASKTYDDFRELNVTLNEKGTHPEPSPAKLLSPFELAGAVAAPRTQVSDEVVPWRPNRGVYLLIERLSDPGSADRFKQVHEEQVQVLSEMPGVAGVWWFATPSYRLQEPVVAANVQLTLCYLDADPTSVAETLHPLVDARWKAVSVEPWFAGPFESLVEWNWNRFL